MSVNEQFEKNAAMFRKDTGIWPLGKDRAAAAGPIDEREVRSLAYIYWEKQQELPAENETLKVALDCELNIRGELKDEIKKLKEKIVSLNDHIACLQVDKDKPF